MNYMGGVSCKVKMSGLCRTDRPYIPRLKPARGALPSISSLTCARGSARNVLLGVPGKDPKRLSGGSKGVKPLWGLRAKRAALRLGNSFELDRIRELRACLIACNSRH